MEVGLLGGRGLPTGSGGGRLLRPEDGGGVQGPRRVGGAWDQPRPGLCGELRASPVSGLPPAGSPRSCSASRATGSHG